MNKKELKMDMIGIHNFKNASLAIIAASLIKIPISKSLNAIKEFWSKGKRDGKIKNAKDLYVYNFFPVAAGKSDDYVLQTKGLSAQTIAKANPVFNKRLGRPINTPLTVGDLGDYYEMTGMV